MNTNKLNVLVFDDSKIHRAAAQAQLKEHNLTVVGTYDETQELITPKLDYKRAEGIVRKEFPDFKPYDNGVSKEQRDAYQAAWKRANQEATTYPTFDVVLTDLLVPASKQAQGPDGYQFIGQEMPVGVFIALLAAAKGKVKHVAVFTDSDHHSHPASACFDRFNEGEGNPTPFMVNGCKFLLSNSRGWVNHFDPNDLAKELKYEEYKGRSDTVRAKNWKALLDYLLT